MDIDFTKITDNKEVIRLLKQKLVLEQKIKDIDEYALILLEYQLLGIEENK